MLLASSADYRAGPTTLLDPVSDDGLAARFEREVMPLRNRLYSRAIRLTRNQQDAEDLVQDTILHAYAGFGSFHEGTNPMAWL